MFIQPEDFGVNLVSNTPDGQLHAEWHMDICRAVDMTKLHVVLDNIVAAGHMSPRQRDAFCAQAGGLLATMLSDCARSFIGSAAQSTLGPTRQYGVAARI